MNERLRAIWKDQVWSKVIAGAILAAVAGLWGFHGVVSATILSWSLAVWTWLATASAITHWQLALAFVALPGIVGVIALIYINELRDRETKRQAISPDMPRLINVMAAEADAQKANNNDLRRQIERQHAERDAALVRIEQLNAALAASETQRASDAKRANELAGALSAEKAIHDAFLAQLNNEQQQERKVKAAREADFAHQTSDLLAKLGALDADRMRLTKALEASEADRKTLENTRTSLMKMLAEEQMTKRVLQDSLDELTEAAGQADFEPADKQLSPDAQTILKAVAGEDGRAAVVGRLMIVTGLKRLRVMHFVQELCNNEPRYLTEHEGEIWLTDVGRAYVLSKGWA